jgi:hypothetical protein
MAAARSRRRRGGQRGDEAAGSAATAAAAALATADAPAESCGAEEEAGSKPTLRLPDLGFDYPELRDVKRRLRRALACVAPCPPSAVRRAYAQALGEALDDGVGNSGGGGGGYAWGPSGLLAAHYASASSSSSSPSSSSPCPAAAERELAGFVRAALAALLLPPAGGNDNAPLHLLAAAGGPLAPAALEQLAPCPDRDPTLPSFPLGARLLLAANLRDAGRAAPSAAVQAVRLALALPPGAVAVGMHEGRSSDRTPFALSVLRLLLLPLRVPQNVTTGGRADPPRARADALPRIERMAALRDAALAPWLGSSGGGGRSGRGSAADNEDEDDDLLLALGIIPRLTQKGQQQEEEEERRGGTIDRSPLARPDVVAFANDALFCAEDVLRLAAHRAPIACGFDFYSAPWQVAAAEQRRQRGGGGGGGTTTMTAARRPAEDDAGELEDPAVRRDYEEDYDGEELRERKKLVVAEERSAVAAASGSHSSSSDHPRRRALPPGRGAARHYDKWVSRDRLGARLSNRPPYVRDEASARELGRGMPVAAYCCWNGLALLDAGPLAPAAEERGWWSSPSSSPLAEKSRGGGEADPMEASAGTGGGIVFRAGGQHPRDCPASSECSLLCDDYRRAAAAAAAAAGHGGPHYRAVLDPAVRLAYDPAQSRALFGGGSGKGAASSLSSAAAAIPGFDIAPLERSLGPRRRWREVAGVAARLAATPVTPDRVDCCSLRPGKNFVRFRSDCAPLEWKEDE